MAGGLFGTSYWGGEEGLSRGALIGDLTEGGLKVLSSSRELIKKGVEEVHPSEHLFGPAQFMRAQFMRLPPWAREAGEGGLSIGATLVREELHGGD
jgi:hypothetical protein